MKSKTDTLEYHYGPRVKDLVQGVDGTLTKILRKEFTAWARAYADFDQLKTDALTEALLALKADDWVGVPAGIDLQPYVNKGVVAALKEHRRNLKIMRMGNTREVPWDPMVSQDRNEGHLGFEVFSDEDFVGGAQGESEPAPPMPVDLTLLDENEIKMLELLGARYTSKEVAGACGWDPTTMKTDHRGFVQNRLAAIRRKLCDGARTQQQARDWLEQQ